MIDPKDKQAFQAAVAHISATLDQPEVADDVTCMTLAFCRLKQDERAELLHRAHAMLNDRVSGNEITRQYLERGRLRRKCQADGNGGSS